MNNTKSLIDLKPFCDDEDHRFSLSKPWLADGIVYATDGRILVQTTSEFAPDAKLPEGRVPKSVSDVFKSFDLVTDWRKCPKPTNCDSCNNTGRLAQECTLCKGDGVCVCACGHEHDCGNCEGDGLEDAGQCNKCLVELWEQCFAAKYVAKIVALPKVRIGPAPHDSSMMYFKCEGGRGALMATRRDD